MLSQSSPKLAEGPNMAPCCDDLEEQVHKNISGASQQNSVAEFFLNKLK